MFGSVLLEILIGLSFIYVMLSLLVTTISELIMAMLDARGKNLRVAVVAMLDDHQGSQEGRIWPFSSLGNTRLGKLTLGIGRVIWTWINRKTPQITWQEAKVKSVGYSQEVFDHPIFKKLRKPGSSRFPSYVSAANFSRILLDVLSKEGEGDKKLDKISNNLNQVLQRAQQAETVQRSPSLQGNDPATGGTEDGKAAADKHAGAARANAEPGPLFPQNTARVLLCLIEESHGSLEYFQAEVERWYNDVMNRASAWYKRKSQIAIFIIGLLTCMALNADTIKIAKTLKNSPQARAQVVDMAVQYAEAQNSARADTAAARQDVEALLTDIETLVRDQIQPVGGIAGLGWAGNVRDRIKGALDHSDPFKLFGLKLVGWLLTTLAVSLGAPFWFDMLNKVINLRGTTKPSQAQMPQNPGIVAVG